MISSVREVPVNKYNKEKIEDVIVDSRYPLVEPSPGPLDKCKSRSDYILPMSTLIGPPLTPSRRLLRE